MKRRSRHLLLAVVCLSALTAVVGCAPTKQKEPSKSQPDAGGTVISQLFSACKRGDINGAKATLTPDSIASLERFFAAGQANRATVGWDQFVTYIASLNEPECRVAEGDKAQVQCTNLGRNFHFAIITIDQQAKIQLPPLSSLQSSTSW